jgi:hypothetical protein
MEEPVMSRQSYTKSVVTPLSPWDELWSGFEPQDSRTVRRWSPAALVPSAIVLLSMSIVTVVTIVGIVTAVAGTKPLQGSDGNLSRWSSSPEIQIGDNNVGPWSYTTIVDGQMIELAIDGEYIDAVFIAPEP